MRGRCGKSMRVRGGRSAVSVFFAGLVVLAAASPSAAFELTSPAFTPGGQIPARYTCDGSNVSPPLRWSAPPAGTRAYVLVADDPDAPGGTWVHWVLYGVPPSVERLPEAVPARGEVDAIGRQGLNDFQRTGYGGPCPPRGSAHRYVFKLYALDREVSLPPGKTKTEALQAMEGHVLATAELRGRYQRR